MGAAVGARCCGQDAAQSEAGIAYYDCCRNGADNDGLDAAAGDVVTMVVKRGEGSKLGITLETNDGDGLSVLGITDGAGLQGNQANVASPKSCLQVHDQIFAVNGERQDAQKMLAMMKSDLALELAVRRGGGSTYGLGCFTVSRTAEEESFGLHLDAVDGVSAVVVGVEPGAVQRWNEANPDCKLRPRDRLIEVNGQRGDVEEMLKKMKTETQLTFRAQRPRNFHCQVNSSTDAYMGMDLVFAPDGKSLCIKEIGDGPVEAWNRNVSGQQRVAALDRIVEVNGRRGDPPVLLEAFRANAQHDIVIAHYGA